MRVFEDTRHLAFGKLAIVFVGFLSLSFAGCLRVQGTIFRDGSAELQLEYLLPRGTLDTERLKFASPDIEILAARIQPRRRTGRSSLGGRLEAYFQLRTDDLGSLSDAYMFRFVTVTKLQQAARVPPDNVSGLTVKIRNDQDPRRDLETVRLRLSFISQPVVIQLTFPGRITSSNADSIDENRATWRFSCADFFADPEVTMTAWYVDASSPSVGREESDRPGLGGGQGRAS